MNIDTLKNTLPTKNRFPIVAQLGILVFIMIVLFGALLLPNKGPQEPTVETVVITDNTELPIVAQKIEEVPIRAKAAYVWDVREQRPLYSKNADQALPLASITKLMTALLAYELIEDNARTDISLSAIEQEGSSGFFAGEELEIEELRKIALISSSNDAAFALAASVGTLLGDSNPPTTQFIQGMNIRAEELGLNSLMFKNTTGLDLSTTEPGAIGSARDVSFLMEYIITHHPDIITPTQVNSARVYSTTGEYHDINNTNEIALEVPNMIGSKTGFTDLAGGNLTVAFDAGLDRPVIITVLGSTRESRFTDVLTLVEAVQKSVSQPK